MVPTGPVKYMSFLIILFRLEDSRRVCKLFHTASHSGFITQMPAPRARNKQEAGQKKKKKEVYFPQNVHKLQSEMACSLKSVISYLSAFLEGMKQSHNPYRWTRGLGVGRNRSLHNEDNYE